MDIQHADDLQNAVDVVLTCAPSSCKCEEQCFVLARMVKHWLVSCNKFESPILVEQVEQHISNFPPHWENSVCNQDVV